MQIITRHLRHMGRTDEARVYLLACSHLGNAGADETALRRVVAMIAQDEDAYWVHLGDVCEWISRRDPRYNEEDYASWLWGVQDIAASQRARAIEMFKPIGGKLLALCEGNHEASIMQHEDRDVYHGLAEGLTTERVCLGHRGILDLRFHRSEGHERTCTIQMMLTHGSGGGQSAGTVANRLAQMAQMVDGADVVACGHFHREYWRAAQRIRCVQGRLHRVTAWQLGVPSFLREAIYAERKDYAPHGIGYGVLTIRPDRHTVGARVEML